MRLAIYFFTLLCAVSAADIATPPAGRIDIDFERISSYQPGEGQEIRVSVVAGKIHSRFGVHVTAEDLQGRQAGVFSLLDESVAIHASDNGKQYLTHHPANTRNEFRFRWTAPVNDVGPIRFHAVGVALDASSTNSESMSATFDLRAAGTTVIPSGYKWDFIDNMSDAVALSNDGRILGAGLLRNADGSMVTIQVPGSVSFTVADVNSAGIVVGTYKDSGNTTHGFVRSAGGAITTVDYPGGTNSELLAINDQGQALGRMQLNNVRRNFLRAPDGTLQLIDNSVSNGELLDLTNDGRFLGLRGEPRAIGVAQALYILRQGEPGTNVNTCTGSRGGTGTFVINDRADLLMNCTEIGPGFFPFQNDRIHFSSGEVESFPPSADGVYLVTPKSINASGQIAGVGTVTGDGKSSRAVILTPCEVSVSSGPIHFPFDGGTATVRVRGPAGCRARVGRTNYFRYSPPGPGDGLIVITAEPITSTSPLTDSITIGNTTIAMTQDGRPPALNCTYSVSATRLRFSANGGFLSLTVNAPAGCPWTIAGLPSWITTTDPTSASGYGSIFGPVAANTSSARNATISVGGQTLAVQQLGLGDCTVLPGVSSLAVYTFGSLDIAANPGCNWTVSSDSQWLKPSLSDSADALSVSGAGPASLFVSADANPQAFSRTANITVNGQIVVVTQFGKAVTGYYFVPSAPCRIADTRPEGNKWTGFGPPSIALGGTRVFALAAAGCGIPSSATAVSANITVVPKGYLGFLTAWQAGQSKPLSSTLNSWNGRVVANAAILPVAEGASISIYVANETDVIIDVNGYFISGSNSGLQFFPVNPCRVVDTRGDGGKTGEFGPPSIPVGGGTRSFRVPQSGCQVPSNAQAYSLNVTAVPPGYLAYLTAWPTGQDQPFVSTLNSWDGQVVPNAAIVPAGTNGAISVYSPNTTDVVIDVNGYFAPPAPGGMNYYPVTPCRVADTRASEGKTGVFGPPSIQTQTLRTLPIPASGCGVPLTAKAFALNLTAVPPGYLGFVTAWPAGSSQPLASTLNSWNGQVVANAAIVPAGSNGAVSFFVSNTTDLVVDLNGFFQ